MVVLLRAFAQGSGQGDCSLVPWLAFPSSLSSLTPLRPGSAASARPFPWAYPSVPTHCMLSNLGLPSALLIVCQQSSLSPGGKFSGGSRSKAWSHYHTHSK